MGLFILVPGWRSRGFRRCGDDGQGYAGAIKQLHFVICVCLLRLDALYVFFVVHVWFGVVLIETYHGRDLLAFCLFSFIYALAWFCICFFFKLIEHMVCKACESGIMQVKHGIV